VYEPLRSHGRPYETIDSNNLTGRRCPHRHELNLNVPTHTVEPNR
jgi:hypothetical protein